MFSLFSRKERIVCPRCLLEVQVEARQPKDIFCPECKFRMPLAYVRDYKHALPVFIQLFGWSQVGKSMYLDVLRLFLYDMAKVWDKYDLQPITQLDLDMREVLLTERRNGRVPGSTPKRERDQNEVYVMYLHQMERWQSRFLVMMDHAGEMFARMDDFPMKEIPFLQHTPTTFMLFSLPDMLGGGKRMDDLLNIYITALEQNGVNFNKARRRLIVVFTKGDLIPDLPDHINDYLLTDTMWTLITSRGQQAPLDSLALAEYLERMGRVSDAIKLWVEHEVDGGMNMMRLIERKNIDARFSVISATGQDVQPGSGEMQLRPRRVLDPFFWAMEFQSK